MIDNRFHNVEDLNLSVCGDVVKKEFDGVNKFCGENGREIMITLEMFDEVEMRVGTIIRVSLNKRARKPAYKITVDLGEYGIKNSSAQLTNYEMEELVGKQVVCVCNFEPIRIGDVKSEVRILGSDTEDGCILLTSLTPVKNGSKIY